MTKGQCYFQSMLGRLYSGQDCAIARALELVGERWSLLIVRDTVFRGPMRFTELQRSLGVAPNILAKRLEHLVEAEVLEVGGDGDARRYQPTERGRDLVPLMMAATAWGEKWVRPGPIDYVDRGSGHEVELQVVDGAGASVAPENVGVRLRAKPNA